MAGGYVTLHWIRTVSEQFRLKTSLGAFNLTIKAFRFNRVPTDATGGFTVTQHLAVNQRKFNLHMLHSVFRREILASRQ
jgi:hypothetical protein